MRALRIAGSSAALLKGDWRRTLLAMAAFVVGVGALTMFLVIMQSAEANLRRILHEQGENVLTVRAAAVQTMGDHQVEVRQFRALRLADELALKQSLGSFATVGGFRSTMESLHWQRRKEVAPVIAATPEYPSIRNLRIDADVLAAFNEGRRPVAVIGNELAGRLFDYEPAVGQRIAVRSTVLAVVGTFGSNGSIESEEEQRTIVVPLRFLSQSGALDTILIQARLSSSLAVVSRKTRAILRERRSLSSDQPDDFTIIDNTAALAARQRVGDVVAILLPSVAGVAILTGAIGVFAVMLVAVRDRAGEIGLRRALGASAFDILIQFLLDATAISCAGAALGAGLGTCGAVLAVKLSHWPLTIPWGWVGLSAAGAVLFGSLAGLWPALRAAALEPAAALRAS